MMITIITIFRKYHGNKTRKKEIKELQKTATLGTVHVVRKALI
jgi:hypothetical protein